MVNVLFGKGGGGWGINFNVGKYFCNDGLVKSLFEEGNGVIIVVE